MIESKIMNSINYLDFLKRCKHVAIVGSSGSIGNQFLTIFSNSEFTENVYSLSRTPIISSHSKIKHMSIDYSDENSIITAKESIINELDLIIICTGALHSKAYFPEKALTEYTTEKAQFFYLTNTIGPSLIMKHLWPLLSKKSLSICASICARIGSIEDNKLGGWYSYRASKAALMMMIKSLSIEIKRRNKNAICVGLHPGTVDSHLSKPFQKHIKAEKLFSPEQSVDYLLTTFSQLNHNDTGYQFSYDGTRIPA